MKNNTKNVDTLTKVDLIHLINIVKKSKEFNSVMGITLESTLRNLLKNYDNQIHPNPKKFSLDDIEEIYCNKY